MHGNGAGRNECRPEDGRLVQDVPAIGLNFGKMSLELQPASARQSKVYKNAALQLDEHALEDQLSAATVGGLNGVLRRKKVVTRDVLKSLVARTLTIPRELQLIA